jgi:hypothetical protein
VFNVPEGPPEISDIRFSENNPDNDAGGNDEGDIGDDGAEESDLAALAVVPHQQLMSKEEKRARG